MALAFKSLCDDYGERVLGALASRIIPCRQVKLDPARRALNRGVNDSSLIFLHRTKCDSGAAWLQERCNCGAV